MNPFKKLLAGLVGQKPAPPPPPPAHEPNLLAVDGQVIDLAALNEAQLAELEAYLLERGKQREEEFTRHLLDLCAQREQLLAARNREVWLMSLKLMFGETIGRRVAAQDIVPGMQLQHLVMSFGRPHQVEPNSTGLTFVYGTRQTGSYFDIEGDVITKAIIIAPPPLVDFQVDEDNR
jgi:hypothetical protein